MHSFHLYGLPVVYLAVSLPIFYRIYDTSKVVIDEEFHIRQAKYYCVEKFGVWDPKITTFPGLYFFSYWLLPFEYCTTFYLRMISLLASVFNIVLVLKIRNRGEETDIWNLMLDTFNVTILPPMYFFAHLYYTDVLSITTVLSLYYYWQEKKHFKAAISGALSILMRQTNVIWIVMVVGISSLDELIKNYSLEKKIRFKQVDLLNPEIFIDVFFRNFRNLFESVVNVLNKFHVYISVIIAFGVFVFFNGSIVVGDKSAHTAVVHIPQIFYFSLFFLIFGFPSLLPNIASTIKTMKTKWKLALRMIAIASVIVAYNTMVHPYLLADNRHYTFYIWNRFYARYSWFKFTMVPVYVFSLFLAQDCIKHKSRNFQIMYWVCTFIVLVPQKLLEVRYFLIPFLLLRLSVNRVQRVPLILELSYYILINAVTLYIFFTKNIFWDDFLAPQKLIW